MQVAARTTLRHGSRALVCPIPAAPRSACPQPPSSMFHTSAPALAYRKIEVEKFDDMFQAARHQNVYFNRHRLAPPNVDPLEQKYAEIQRKKLPRELKGNVVTAKRGTENINLPEPTVDKNTLMSDIMRERPYEFSTRFHRKPSHRLEKFTEEEQKHILYDKNLLDGTGGKSQRVWKKLRDYHTLFTPALEEKLEEKFEELYQEKYRKNFDYGEIVQTLNDAEREFWMDWHAEVPHPETDEYVKEAMQIRLQEMKEEMARFKDVPKFVRYERIATDYITRKAPKGKRVVSVKTMLFASNEDGLAAFGHGKGAGVGIATLKARRDLTKNLIFFPKLEGRTIPYEVTGHFHGTKIWLKPLPRNSGIVASWQMQDIIEALGLTDISVKVWNRRNKKNIIYALFHALHKLQSIKDLAEARGLNYFKLADDGRKTHDPDGNLLVPRRDEVADNMMRVMEILRGMSVWTKHTRYAVRQQMDSAVPRIDMLKYQVSEINPVITKYDTPTTQYLREANKPYIAFAREQKMGDMSNLTKEDLNRYLTDVGALKEQLAKMPGLKGDQYGVNHGHALPGGPNWEPHPDLKEYIQKLKEKDPEEAQAAMDQIRGVDPGNKEKPKRRKRMLRKRSQANKHKK